MFYSWFGFTLYVRARPEEGYRHLSRALELGEESGNRRLVGFACGGLTWTCAELGLLDDAVVFGERGYDIARSLDSDSALYQTSLGAIGLYQTSLGALGVASNHRGDRRRATQAGEVLLDIGKRQSDLRLMGFGHSCIGLGHMIAGDYAKAMQCFQRVIQVSADPITTVFAKLFLCHAHFQEGQFEKAEEEILQVQTFSRNFGMEMYDQYLSGVLGVLDMSKGRVHKGLKSVEQARNVAKERGSKYGYASFEGLLGRIYMQMVVRGEPTLPFTPSLIVKNLGFFIRNLPFAAKKAEAHLNQAIALNREMGANHLLGQACLDLAILHKTKKRSSKARECLSEAIILFEQCEADAFLQQAKEELASLN